MKQLIAMQALLAIASLIGAPSASAQNMVLQATIPFDFTVGETLLPAGTYLIGQAQPRVISIENDKKNVRVFSMIQSTDIERRSTNRLLFHKYGDQYFLNQICGLADSTALNLGSSKTEKHAEMREAGLQKQQQVVLASK
jgi:hypothetical protein